MGKTYTTERLSLFDALLKRDMGVSSGRLWTIEPAGLRFKHGESMAELKVPYHMGGEDEECIDQALLGLVTLLMKRWSPDEVQHGSKPAVPPPIQVPELKDKTFRTDIFIADSLEKKAASAILSSTPNVDSALLSAWLTGDGHGKKFVEWAGDIFEKVLLDEAGHAEDERTSHLLLLAVVKTIRKKKERAKGLRVKGLTYERLDLVTGMTLFTTLRSVIVSVLERLKAARSSTYNPVTEALLLSAIEPFSFLLIPSNLLSVSLNPYGINTDTHDLIEQYAIEPTDESESTGRLVKETLARARGRDEVLEAAANQHDINRFREESLKYLMEFNVPGSEAQAILYELYNEDRVIRNFLADDKSRRNLSNALEGIKKTYTKDRHRVGLIESFQEFLSGFRKKMLGGRRKGGRKESASALEGFIENFYACRLDAHVAGFEGLMRGYLADRRDEFNQNTLVEEYNRGRLYRFSRDERPVLKTLAVEEEGQLFIDMKDFSRKTLKVKEIAMADFMKEYFYRPILSAASNYGVGDGVFMNEKGIRLTNIPGDAAIFSGGVANLVSLAKDIQKIIGGSREQLLKRLPARNEDDMLDEVHKRFEKRKEILMMKREELNEALERGEPGIESRLIALGEEEHRLENIYRQELEDAIQGELEAGLYISFGTKAETTVIEPREGFSDSVKVAIGEKINESARGTFRNPMVRAKLEVLLENERVIRKDKGVAYPFDIYIDRIYAIKMPPELDSAFEKLIGSKKASSAQAMAQVMANKYLSDLKRIVAGEPFSSLRLITCTTDIYNRGQALSESALTAYMKETRGRKRFFQRTVEVHDLHPSIQEQFFFPSTPLEFWFGIEVVDGAEEVAAFYRSGEIIFKGFEARTPTVVYEMINVEGKFFKAVRQHHFQQWLYEAEREQGK